MALPTCDKLKLPDVIISLVKSYVWHDLTAVKNKYELHQHLKHDYIIIRSVYNYSSYVSVNVYHVVVDICKTCGDFRKYMYSRTDCIPYSCTCKCAYTP